MFEGYDCGGLSLLETKEYFNEIECSFIEKAHNDWRLIITIFGWLTLIKGIVRIGFSEIAQKSVKAFENKQILIKILLIIMVVLGAWLIWTGFYQ